jgi:hypothetical protein
MTEAQSVPAASPATAAAVEETAFSVFEGLALAGVTDRMIARFCGVDRAGVADWRNGREAVPKGRVVFLTLLLSHMVDELVRTYDEWGPAPKAWHLHMQACLENAQAMLGRQQDRNKDAPEGAFRQGMRLFEQWLELDAAHGWACEAAKRVALGTDTTGLGT